MRHATIRERKVLMSCPVRAARQRQTKAEVLPSAMKVAYKENADKYKLTSNPPPTPTLTISSPLIPFLIFPRSTPSPRNTQNQIVFG